jgi:hypothetical protein
MISLAATASAQPKAAPPAAERTTVAGVIKEVNPVKKSVVFVKWVEGSYGSQQITDLMILDPQVSISLNGSKVPLKELRPGDRVIFECASMPERAVRVAALSPEQFERLKKENERIKEYEKKVEADHWRLIQELARKEFAADRQRAKEKAKNEAEKAKAPMPKDGDKKDQR